MGKNYFNGALCYKMKQKETKNCKQTNSRNRFPQSKAKTYLRISEPKNGGGRDWLMCGNSQTLDFILLKLSEALTENSCRKYIFDHKTIASHSAKTYEQFTGSPLLLELPGLSICKEILPAKQDCSVLKVYLSYFWSPSVSSAIHSSLDSVMSLKVTLIFSLGDQSQSPPALLQMPSQ